MALDGIEPVIIFKLYARHPKWLDSNAENPDKIGQEIDLKEWQNMSEAERFPYIRGVIPVYLGGLLGGEQLTGIALDDADQSIDFGQTSVAGLFFQKNMGNTVSLTFRARRDNPIMIALLAIVSQIVALIPTQKYGITLYYDSTFILNGTIKNITHQTINNSNIKLVQIVVTETPPATESEKTKQSLPNTAGSGKGPYTG